MPRRGSGGARRTPLSSTWEQLGPHPSCRPAPGAQGLGCTARRPAFAGRGSSGGLSSRGGRPDSAAGGSRAGWWGAARPRARGRSPGPRRHLRGRSGAARSERRCSRADRRSAGSARRCRRFGRAAGHHRTHWLRGEGAVNSSSGPVLLSLPLRLELLRLEMCSSWGRSLGQGALGVKRPCVVGDYVQGDLASASLPLQPLALPAPGSGLSAVPCGCSAFPSSYLGSRHVSTRPFPWTASLPSSPSQCQPTPSSTLPPTPFPNSCSSASGDSHLTPTLSAVAQAVSAPGPAHHPLHCLWQRQGTSLSSAKTPGPCPGSISFPAPRPPPPPQHQAPPTSGRALTVTALAPVVCGEAVVALGSRRAFAALAEARLVAPIVHGADLVAVALWTDRAPCAFRATCGHGPHPAWPAPHTVPP